jgi:hypothetical protein
MKLGYTKYAILIKKCYFRINNEIKFSTTMSILTRLHGTTDVMFLSTQTQGAFQSKLLWVVVPKHSPSGTSDWDIFPPDPPSS